DRKNRRQFFSDPGIISASEKTETTVQSARQRENSLFIPSLFMNYSLILKTFDIFNCLNRAAE
ncbi:hypothetical protein J6Y50_00685, partial [bacterium]|nr:hypothetical protein [bacterium]